MRTISILAAAWPRFQSVEERAARAGGRSTGFDYLRFVLASSIILVHTVIVSEGLVRAAAFQRSLLGSVFDFVLPMFFALSGFLVAGSLQRCPTLVSFFSLRLLRIVPALGVEITISALILGPMLTTLPLAEYFGSPLLHRYFLNILGHPQFYLPGVFATNPLPHFVNAQLWTVPFELECYLVLGGLAAGLVLRRPGMLLLLTLVGQALWIQFALTAPDEPGRANIASGADLVISFMFGLLFHVYRQRIPMHWGIFAAAFAAGMVLAMLPHGAAYLPLPATYMTVYLGLLNPPKSKFLAQGDYSYGLFLYGYPIQQFVASLGGWAQHWWVNLLLAYPVAVGVAMVSWHWVEKPALGLRRYIPALEQAVTRVALPRGPAQGVSGLATAVELAAFAAASLGVVTLVDTHDMLGMSALVAAGLLAYVAALLRRAPGRRQAASATRIGHNA